MTDSVLSIVFLAIVTAGVFIYWRYAIVKHQSRIDQLDVRVHVNGIRGKSSVTRLVAGVLREGGYLTVAKTTGSAARVIGTRGGERHQAAWRGDHQRAGRHRRASRHPGGGGTGHRVHGRPPALSGVFAELHRAL